MPKYLCVSAIWVEGENADDAADRFTTNLAPEMRGKGKVTVYSEEQTHQDGFLLDAAKFDLEDAVVPKGNHAD